MKRSVPYSTRAKEIAAMIRAVNTDDRGLLFLEISNELYANAQNFTGSLFKKIAERYGYPEQSSGGVS